MQQIETKLRKLKLSGIVKSLELRNRYAIDNQLSYMEFIEQLLEDEMDNRKTNRMKKMQSKSKLAQNKNIEEFSFSYQPKLNKKSIYDLATCNYIEKGENIIFMGKPGVGKTHLANALGLEAIKQGYEVYFTDASLMLYELYKSRIEGRYEKTLRKYTKPDLLIIDEIGFKAMKKEAVDDFFEVIKTRYERRSIILTSNRNFEEWDKLFGDQVPASAILDRLLHHAHIFKLTGESYRIKQYFDKKKN